MDRFDQENVEFWGNQIHRETFLDPEFRERNALEPDFDYFRSDSLENHYAYFRSHKWTSMPHAYQLDRFLMDENNNFNLRPSDLINLKPTVNDEDVVATRKALCLAKVYGVIHDDASFLHNGFEIIQSALTFQSYLEKDHPNELKMARNKSFIKIFTDAAEKLDVYKRNFGLVKTALEFMDSKILGRTTYLANFCYEVCHSAYIKVNLKNLSPEQILNQCDKEKKELFEEVQKWLNEEKARFVSIHGEDSWSD